MNIYSFITGDEINELPDDPRLAFATFINIAYGRFQEKFSKLKSVTEINASADLQHSFMNVTIAVARRYGISEFSDYSVPSINKFDGMKFREYISELDSSITLVAIDSRLRMRDESVLISNDVRTQIKTYIHYLRDLIEKSAVPDPKRRSLLDKLDEFERELEKKRVSYLAVAGFAIYMATIPGGIAGTVDASSRLVNQILGLVGEAQDAERQSRTLQPIAPPAALSPPQITATAAENADDAEGAGPN